MSLLRQLLLSVTVVIVAILIGTLVFSINGARNYLNNQLQSESDNAATSLALTLSQPSNQDPATRELLITALFDSGQFSAIRLTNTKRETLVGRQLQRSPQSTAPDWFSKLLPLRHPSATREVSSGWTQVGALTVVADDTSAKNSLWESSSRIFMWVLAAGILWLAFVQVLLGWLKRSLHAEITRQVDAIADGKEASITTTPKAVADLLPSNNVIAQARERVQASREEASSKIESLTVELNTDSITALPNRRYFMNELRKALSTEENSGYIMLFRQRDLVEIARAMPRDQVDAWLLEVGERLKQVVKMADNASMHVARLNGSDFVALVNGIEAAQAMGLAQEVRATLQESRIAITAGKLCRWAMAMTDYITGESLPEVISRLDTALMGAESSGGENVEVLLRRQQQSQSGKQIIGEEAWRDMLLGALANHNLSLSTTLANYGPEGSGPDRYEATLMLSAPQYGDGKLLSGYLFMPAAVRLGMSAEMDERALKLALNWLAYSKGDLVVRISAPSLIRDGFINNVTRVLNNNENLNRLIVELDAFGLATYTAEFNDLAQKLQSLGVRIGLRGLSRQLDAVALLQGLPIFYIRMGGGFMEYLESSQGALTLLQAVMHTAAALDIHIQIDDTLGEMGGQLVENTGALLKRIS